MRLLTSEAIVLETRDLTGGDRLVVFLSREHGSKRGAARGAKRRYSRFAGQLQPLATVHLTWAEKEGRDLVRIRSVELLRPADRLQADLEGILLACYLAEQVEVFAAEGDVDERLYRLLRSTVDALLAGVDRHLAARYFEAWILRLTGIFPPPRSCPQDGAALAGGAVLPRGGEALLCARCAGDGAGLGVPPDVVSFLVRIGAESLPAVAASPPEAPVLDRVEQLCAEVRRGFLQTELKSYLVMQRTLDGA